MWYERKVWGSLFISLVKQEYIWFFIHPWDHNNATYFNYSFGLLSLRLLSKYELKALDINAVEIIIAPVFTIVFVAFPIFSTAWKIVRLNLGVLFFLMICLQKLLTWESKLFFFINSVRQLWASRANFAKIVLGGTYPRVFWITTAQFFCFQ